MPIIFPGNTDLNSVISNLLSRGFREATGYPRQAKTFKVRKNCLYVNHGKFVSKIKYREGKIKVV